MSHPNPDDAEPEQLEDQDAELLVADPDDYHEAQRLREIHDARQKVTDQIADLDIDEQQGTGVFMYDVTRLANLVATYVFELEPLIRQADLEDHNCVTLPDEAPHDTIWHYATMMGTKESGKPGGLNYSMEVYRRCNSLLGELKPLVTEDSTDKWEV